MSDGSKAITRCTMEGERERTSVRVVVVCRVVIIFFFSEIVEVNVEMMPMKVWMSSVAVQAIEITSFSRLSRPLDEVMEIWSISVSISVRGIPTLNSVALSLLMLPWQTRSLISPSLSAGKGLFVPVIQPH